MISVVAWVLGGCGSDWGGPRAVSPRRSVFIHNILQCRTSHSFTSSEVPSGRKALCVLPM